MTNRTNARWLNWPTHLTVLFTGVFLLQFVVYASEFWLDETYKIVVGTIAAVLVLDGLLIRYVFTRFLVQAVAVLCINGFVIRKSIDFDLTHVDSFRTAGQWIGMNSEHLHPYIWFSAGAWFIASFTWRFMRSKQHIIVITILSVLVMSGIDSFTTHILWDQIALIIFAGLCLLVTNHFRELMERNPTSWNTLAEYPSSILVPVGLIISVVMTAGAVAPQVNPILTDPYTAWQQFRGNEVAFTTAKGRPITLRSPGSSASGYSRSDDVLGGGFEFDYSPVMEVTTTKRSYWRGETKSIYSGEGWLYGPDSGNTAAIRSTIAPLDQEDGLDRSKLEQVEVRQLVRMIRDDSFPVLFGAMTIDGVTSVDGVSGDLLPMLNWSPESKQLSWRSIGNQPYPEIYDLISQVPIIDESELREVTNESVDPDQLWMYLQLPDALPSEVRHLAAEIADPELTLYDKAKQIETYLKTNYAYNNKPDISAGNSKDFVYRFLFEIQEGYCDYYSTAMVVMARSVGIPARWVKGYTSGHMPVETDRLGLIIPPTASIDPNGPGTYTVRNADAHSWAELYFEGYGWIPFEATAGFSMPIALPIGETPEPILAEPVLPELPEDDLVQPTRSSLKGTGMIVLIGAAFLVAIAGWLIWQREAIFRWISRLKAREADRNRRVVHEIDRLFRYCRRKGLHRHDFETVRETMQRWGDSHQWLKQDFHQLFGLFEKAKYSTSQLSEEELRIVLGKVQKLKEEL